MRNTILSIFVLLISEPALAQNNLNYISARLHYGSVIIHSRELRPVKDSYPLGIELDFGKHKVSEKAWNTCNCFPKSGVTIAFWDFDNRDVLGYGFTSMYYVQPVFGARNKLSFSVRGAAGLSYQTKPYDEQNNPNNLSYSTRVAFPLQLGIGLHYRLRKQWKIDLNIAYNHISNGGMKEPNKGINWPTIGLGASRYFRELKIPKWSKTDWRSNAEDLNRFDISAFSTYHQPVSKFFLVSAGLELKYAQRISRLNYLSLASEWMYDNGLVYLGNEEQSINGNILGLALGNEFILGKFLFSQQFGVYLINPINRLEDVYQRYSLMYPINRKFSTGVSLKAHGHVADFLDLRIAYSI